MFQQAKAKNKLELVPMNRTKYVHFGSNKRGLRTENLNGCAAVIIASPTAAIFGHFSPRPSGALPDTATEDVHI